MKRLTSIFLLTTVMTYVGNACSDEEEKDPLDQIGCMTGIPKSGGTTRELIICCTKRQALAGGNVAAGGIARAQNYNSLHWAPVDDCSECQ